MLGPEYWEAINNAEVIEVEADSAEERSNTISMRLPRG